MTLESDRPAEAQRAVVAVVLAAGMGTRLAPFTRSRPKCLVPLHGRPIFFRALDALRKQGVRDVVVTVGYLGDQVRDCLTDEFRGLNVTFVRNDAYAASGSLLSFDLALKRCPRDSDLLLIEGDVVFERDLLAWLLENAHGEIAATALEPYAPHLTGTLALLGPDNYVTDVAHEKGRASDFPLYESYKTTNISVFSTSMRAQLESTVRASLERYGVNAPLEYALSDLVRNGAKMRGVTTGGRKWFEIDTPEDLATAERIFEELSPCAASSAS